MALIKKHIAACIDEFPNFATLQEAYAYFQENDGDFARQSHAITQMIQFDSGAIKLVDMLLQTQDIHREMIDNIAAVLSKITPKYAPIEKIMELLKEKNAYIRNIGISILQCYGDAIKYYIVKFLIGDNRDLRIFAINVLGDVNFAESRDMLIELLQNEKDINVAMTAVDYLAEIGELEDIDLLESLKKRFDDAYVTFAIDNAICQIKG